MQEELNKLIGQSINLCGQTSDDSIHSLIVGNLSRSYLEQDKFVVGDKTVGPTFSFALNQIEDIIGEDVIIKFCLR